MRYVVDTHIFLWLLFDPSKISKEKLEALQESKNLIFISSVSFWEISIKYGLGKLILNGCTPQELPDMAVRMGLEIMDVTVSELATSYNLPRLHKDPFDRLRIHQCIGRKMTLVSEDGKFDGYKEYGLDIL